MAIAGLRIAKGWSVLAGRLPRCAGEPLDKGL